MFTGIVKEQLTIMALHNQVGSVEVTFSLPNWGTLTEGESVLINGVCSTVIRIMDQQFTVEYMPESLQVANVASWQVGDLVHAEPSLTLQTPLSGSVVYGHVDTVTKLVEIKPESGQTIIKLANNEALQPYVMPKGGITLDGVNLTVVAVQPDYFTVHLIPQTQQLTHFTRLSVGSLINVEYDYVMKVLRHWA